MKDAMGELNMTVVTIVAIGAVAAFFTAFLWPNIRENITGGWRGTCAEYDDNGNCVRWNDTQNAVGGGIIVIPNIF